MQPTEFPHLFTRLTVTLALLAGCTAETDPEVAGARASLPAGVDAADTQCQVVLRRAQRARAATGLYETACPGGACWFVVEAVVDVAAPLLEDGAVPGLLHSPPDDPTFYEAEGEPTTGAPAGFQRYRFRLEENTIRDGMSGTSTSRARLQLIPFVRLENGARWFDHNRIADPLATYELLWNDNQLAIHEAPAVCPGSDAPVADADAVVHFDADFTHRQSGAVGPGEKLAVVYDPRRLPQCFGDVYMAQATWSTLAWVDFGNGAEPVREKVVDCTDPRCLDPQPGVAVFDVPADATRIDLWFSTSGRSCGVHWDSNFGANYEVPLATPPAWVGELVYKSSRAGGAPCEGTYDAGPVGDQVFFGTWNRVRAVVNNLCVQVWEPGVTDAPDADLARRFDVALACDFGDGVERRYPVDLEGRPGNNARYSLGLRAIDPFAFYRCPDVPTAVTGPEGAEYVEATATCAYEVNGLRVGPEGPGSTFEIRFQDYASSDWREQNCTP